MLVVYLSEKGLTFVPNLRPFPFLAHLHTHFHLLTEMGSKEMVTFVSLKKWTSVILNVQPMEFVHLIEVIIHTDACVFLEVVVMVLLAFQSLLSCQSWKIQLNLVRNLKTAL